MTTADSNRDTDSLNAVREHQYEQHQSTVKQGQLSKAVQTAKQSPAVAFEEHPGGRIGFNADL